MNKTKATQASNANFARRKWSALTDEQIERLGDLGRRFGFSVKAGDLVMIDRSWYVTHSGLLRLARKKKCVGISAEIVSRFSDPEVHSWSCRAVVFPSKSSLGFTGYGDAEPSNVSPSMRGSELRIAETRAVNRALRKAYGIGLCSVEELGSLPSPPSNGNAKRAPARLGANLEVVTPIPLRDQLRQLIRHERLDPVLTKAYALEHLGVKSLRDATREQISALISHLQKGLEDRASFLKELTKVATPNLEKKEVA